MNWLKFLVLVVLGCGGVCGAATDRPVTYAKDVAPILFENCAGCHRPGETAPFSLLTYEDARKKAKTIVRATQDHYMPPWKAEPGYGDFLGVRRLSDQQIAVIKQWVADGTPPGNPRDLPKPPKFTSGWQLGTPDLVVKMGAPFTVPAEGPDVFQCFVLPLPLTNDTFVTAVEYRASNRRVVHHALLFLDTTGAARNLDEADPAVGYRHFGGVGFLPSGGLGGWVPGTTVRPLPDGVVRVVKKNSDLVVQTHFHPTGKPESEQSEVGLYFSKTPPKKMVLTFPLFGRPLNIAPGETNYTVNATLPVPADVEVIGITPHAHLLGKEMKVTATLPDGTTVPMLWIKNWDFNWQDQYQYKTPLKLPRGTRIVMTHTYDNSADNPNNPSRPPRRVTWGEQTTDEMAICFFQFVVDNDIANLMMLTRDGPGAGRFRKFQR